MEDRSASILGTDDWSELLQATQDALANLGADELETLARHAETLAGRVADAPLTDCKTRESLIQLKMAIPDHLRLGNLLRATNDNLQILDKLNFPRAREGRISPWEL